MERRGEWGIRVSETTYKEHFYSLTFDIGAHKRHNLQMIVSKVEVFETGQACQGVGGQGDYGVVRQVEGGERGQAEEGLVLHLLHGVALQAEAGQPGEGGEGVRGDLADRVEGEVEGAQVGREEVKTWWREGA